MLHGYFRHWGIVLPKQYIVHWCTFLMIKFHLQGYDLSGLEDAVKKRFEEWVAARETRRKRRTETEKELFIKFSEEVFGIKDPK